MFIMSRRDFFKLSATGAAALAVPSARLANAQRLTFALENGFRVHCIPNESRYVSAALILRSKDILYRDAGLSHIMEHTSFTGAAGSLTAREIKQRQKVVIQDGNASTETGTIEWRASFLPKYISEVLHLLSVTSLDQKFDVETVASEAKIVLQELYLDKYGSDGPLKRRFNAMLFGKDHPFARNTTDAEIAKAKTPPDKLAAELREYASTIKLPANMDLFLVGATRSDQVQHLVNEHFGRYSFESGPFLEVPDVGVTRAHYALRATSRDLKRPLSQIKVAWSTGVRITDPEAKTLLALSQYMDEVLFSQLREKHGDTYTPEVHYEPDRCSGIFSISVTSTKDPTQVEKRIFESIDEIKRNVDFSELDRFRERLELKRMKTAESTDGMLDAMVARVIEGASVEDLDIGSVSPDDIVAAARRYLPRHRGAYVSTVLNGK
jgi:predicted Zn-dependent peptidase